MLAITGPEAPPAVNCLLLGDSSADKTTLLCAYLEQLFPGQPQPSFFFEHQVKTTFRGAPVTLKLWDLSGQECYDKLRQLAYKQIGFHVFLVCFSLVDPDSLENAKRLWVPELRWNCPNTPFLLVGTQADLRTDKKTYERLEAEGKSPVSRWTGQRLTKQLKAVAYVECSATRGEGLKELFEEQTLRAGLRTWQKRGGADGRRTNGREESCSLQ